MRKPVGVANDGSGNLVVVCDDGSVHVMLSMAQASLFGQEPGGWRKGSSIPGTEDSEEMVAFNRIVKAWDDWKDSSQEDGDDVLFSSIRDALDFLSENDD